MKKNTSRLVIWSTRICYIVLFCLTSNYSTAEVYTGPVSESTGGAGRAATETPETILLNPASIVHAKVFALGMYFADGYKSPNLHERLYGATLIDNHEESFAPGGLTYFDRKRHFAGVGTVEEMFAQATLGKFIGKYFSMGVAVTYLKQKFIEKHTQWNGQVGAMYTPNDKLGFGLVVQNFVKPKDTIPEFLRESLNIGFGTTYLLSRYFKVKADVVAYDLEGRGWRGKYMVGAESDISDYFAFRLGYRNSDITSHNHFTFGAGLKTPRFGVDYSVSFKEGDRRGAMHSVDIRAPL